jgi:hypothetical protein
MSEHAPKKPADTEATLRSRTIPELTLEDTAPRRGPELSLEDTAAQQRRGLTVKAGKEGAAGYNPYDTGRSDDGPAAPAPPARESAAAPRKPTDLRKLSEWIRAQRRAQAVRQEESQSDEAQERDPQQRK